MSTLRVHIAATVLAALLIMGARAEDAKAEGKWSVAPLLPAETLFLVEATDVKVMIEKLEHTGLWQIVANKDVQNAFRSQFMQAKFGIAMAEMQLGLKVADIASMFSQGEVTFAVLSADKIGNDGNPIPDLLLSVQAKDKAAALLEEINKRIDQLNAQVGGVLEITQAPVGDTSIKSVRVPQQPVSLHYMLCEGNVVAALGEGRLERLLAAREKAKAGEKPADAKPETVSDLPSFKKTMEKSGLADLMMYVNVESVLKNAPFNLRPNNEQDRKVWDALGVDAIRSIAYAIEIKDKGLREIAYVDAPAATRKGLLALMEGDGLDAESLAAAPRNSLAALAVKMSPEKTFDKLLDLAVLENPNAREDINGFLLAKGQELNIDIKKEVFSALTGQAVFSVSMMSKHPKLGVGFPQLILNCGVKDAAALKNIFKALRNVGKERFDYFDLLDGEREIVTVREKFPEGRNPFQISYVIDKNDLIVALYPLALREELRRRAQPAAGPLAGSLADDPDFKTARARLIGKPGAMMYADTAALGVALYDTLIPVAQLPSTPRNEKVDVTMLPTSDVLLHNLGGTVFGLNADDDGIFAEGYSPTGIVSFTMMLIPAAIQQRRENQRNMMEAAVKKQEDMAIVSQALQAYAKDNNGNLPVTLKEMQPKYLPETTNTDDFVFLGKQPAANRVVAHTTEKQRGPISILLQDGTVTKIPRFQLGKVLKEGFTGKAEPAPAGPQDAVKPPKPPDGNF